jgi:hypothetical protein
VLLTLLACGMEASEFPPAAAEAVCTRYEACLAPEELERLGYDPHATCVKTWTGPFEDQLKDGDECATFDADDAQTCLDELDAWSCADVTGGDFPSSCETKYLCPRR